MKGLCEGPLSWGLRVRDNVECTHVFYESRAGVATRRREENRRGERVFRGGHWDGRERRGNHRGHVVVLYCAWTAQAGHLEWALGGERMRAQRGRDSRQIRACRSRLILMFSSKNRSTEVIYKGQLGSIPPPASSILLPIRERVHPPICPVLPSILPSCPSFRLSRKDRPYVSRMFSFCRPGIYKEKDQGFR